MGLPVKADCDSASEAGSGEEDFPPACGKREAARRPAWDVQRGAAVARGHLGRSVQ